MEWREVECPYCGETFETALDPAQADDDYVEDCHVCCRPIVFRVSTDAAGAPLTVSVRREDD